MSVVLNDLPGRLVRMQMQVPIYNDDDEKLGQTQEGDLAVITYEENPDLFPYIEVTIVSGEFAGMTTGFSHRDIRNLVFITNERDDELPLYYKKQKLNTETVSQNKPLTF